MRTRRQCDGPNASEGEYEREREREREREEDSDSGSQAIAMSLILEGWDQALPQSRIASPSSPEL